MLSAGKNGLTMLTAAAALLAVPAVAQVPLDPPRQPLPAPVDPSAGPAASPARAGARPPAAGTGAAAGTAAARDVGPGQRSGARHLYQRHRRRGAEPGRLRCRGARGGDGDGQPDQCVGSCDPALRPGVVGPGVGPCQERGAGRLVRYRWRSQCRKAGRFAAPGAGGARHCRSAERPASDPSAICGAEEPR